MKNNIEILNDKLFSKNLETYLKNVHSFQKTLNPADNDYKLIYTRLIRTEENIKHLKEKQLFRGVDIDWGIQTLKKSFDGLANYTNDFNLAKDYSDIIFEFSFEYNPADLTLESIKNRADNINNYDQEIQEHTKDWYAWHVWDWAFHFRLKNTKVQLKRIIFAAADLKKNFGYLTLLNRLFAGLKQSEFAKLLNTKQPKIAQYENAKCVPDIDRILELSQFLPYPQCIMSPKGNLIINHKQKCDGKIF